MRDSLVCIKELQNRGYLRSDCVASNLTAMNTHKRSDHIYTRTWADISTRLQTLCFQIHPIILFIWLLSKVLEVPNHVPRSERTKI